MDNLNSNLRQCLQKQQEAIDKFKKKKEAFLLSKARIKNDIEEARTIWLNTLEKLPGQPFNE